MKSASNSFVMEVILILLATLISTSVTLGQNVREKRAIANLIVGINSENEGVRKASIYFSGKYQFDHTTDALIKQLNVELNPSIRISIALALYKIGNEKGLEAICNCTSMENDGHVRRIYEAIVEEYAENKYIFASTIK